MAYVTISQKIAAVVPYLIAGRVIAFPTGTSYGLAADTQQGWALQRLRIIKNRPVSKPFTIFMREELWDQFLVLTDCERQFLKKNRLRPLTLLVSPNAKLAHLAKDGRVGLRIIDHWLMRQLAAAVNGPLTATSANRAGDPACFSPAEIERAFTNPLPDHDIREANPRGAAGTTYDLTLAAILDGGILPQKPATTIATIENGAISIVRPGSITLKDLQF